MAQPQSRPQQQHHQYQHQHQQQTDTGTVEGNLNWHQNPAPDQSWPFETPPLWKAFSRFHNAFKETSGVPGLIIKKLPLCGHELRWEGPYLTDTIWNCKECMAASCELDIEWLETYRNQRLELTEEIKKSRKSKASSKHQNPPISELDDINRIPQADEQAADNSVQHELLHADLNASKLASTRPCALESEASAPAPAPAPALIAAVPGGRGSARAPGLSIENLRRRMGRGI